jgi:uncharacterized paraquat-inducible protein A
MNSFSAPERLAPPQKVCPRCSVISQTDAPSCPHCGKDYRRRSVPMTVLLILLWLLAGWMLFGFLTMALISTG